MLLLQTTQKFFFNKNLKNYIQKLDNNILLLKQIRKKKQKLQKLLLNKKFFKRYFFKKIKYIITISALKSNTFVHITDVKRNIKFLVSAGIAGLLGKRQKSKLELALTKILTVLITETQFLTNQPALVRIKNVLLTKSKSYIRHIIGSVLEKRFNIVYFINHSLPPHNGCRPKKTQKVKKKAKKIKFLH